MENKNVKSYNFFQKYFYVIISAVIFIIIVFSVSKAFLFLKKSFNGTFEIKQNQENIHFNFKDLKKINNKINCQVK